MIYCFLFFTVSYMLQGKPRFALFFLAVMSFCLVSGSVLFYAFGYRFNFERGVFIYGGSITLKSNPVQIDVKIDGIQIPAKDLSRLNQSYHISGIIPGEHAIEVSSPGYQTWTKRIVVKSGISNEFWNITLPRQNYEIVSYPGTENLTRYFQSPEPTLFAGIYGNARRIGVQIYDTDQEINRNLYSQPDVTFAFEKNENLEWSPDADRLVFPILSEGKRHVLAVDIETKQTRDLSAELNQFTMMRPRFNPAIQDSLLYRSEGKLYRLDLNSDVPESPLQPLLLAEHVAAYDLSGSDIYIINSEDGILYRFGANEEHPDFRPIIDTPLTDIDSETTLIVYDEYRIAFLSKNGALSFFNAYLSDTPLRVLADQDITGVQFSDDGKKLLFFSSHETFVYFIRPWEVQPRRDQDSIWQIGRFADEISFVQWTKDYEHILYTKGSQVFITELDNRDRRNINELIRFERPPLQVLSRVSQNQIFFIKDNSNESVELLSIDFPEFNNFFTQ
ncbi:MAG: hypothetical protein QG606_449 [Patescibacteria group bacterium]|jgi:hypothetical protein|nr:hypothetical protein [Patescibacteria group bacterium]